MSSPNDNDRGARPQSGAQTYVPPTTPQQARQPAMQGDARVQIASGLMAPSAPPFAPQTMGGPPGGSTGSFAPMVMGGPAGGPMGGPAAPPPGAATGSFAPMVMGGAPAAAPYAPPQAMPFRSPVAPPGAAPVAPPALGTPVAPPPAEDHGLAASPWNTANNPGFNRDLLPSAMLAPPPEPPSAAKQAPARAGSAGEEPSQAPWIIVGVLVLVAIAGGVAVFQIRAHRGKDGQIAVPAGGATATEDAPEESAPSASAPAVVRAAPTVRPVFRPRPTADDPYADVPSRPSNVSRPSPAASAPTTTPTAAPHRIFGTEN